MRFPFSRAIGAALFLLGSAVAVFAVPEVLPLLSAPPTLFSETERAAIVQNWNSPGRYEVAPRPNPKGNGPFVVRLTPQASQWFSNYNRFFKANAASLSVPSSPSTPAPAQQWENWVTAKVTYDRAVAEQQTEAANALWRKEQGTLLISAVPPQELPPIPGPIPDALQLALGDAPPFSVSVAPSRYTIRFESGETVNYSDNISLSAPRYPAYRFAQGVINGGTPLAKIEPAELDRLFTNCGLTPFESHVMHAVSRLEGGFDAINTYDTGFVSVGFIQFAALESGAGTLATLLSSEKTTNPLDFERDFRAYGLDVNDKGTLVALDPTSGAELVGNEAVRKIIDDKRLTAVFELAGRRSDAFRAAQIRVAKAMYYPASLPIQVKIGDQTLSGQVSDIIQSEAVMATLLDRKVNTGNLKSLNDVLTQIVQKHQLTQLTELTKYEREIGIAMKWRRDFSKDPTLTQPQ